jgi:hypothetical protein
MIYLTDLSYIFICSNQLDYEIAGTQFPVLGQKPVLAAPLGVSALAAVPDKVIFSTLP